MDFLAKLQNTIKDVFTPASNIMPEGHKDCEECNGQGVFMIEKCPECDGKGIVKMTYQDYVNSL